MDEEFREPRFVPLRSPTSVDDEQPIDLGRHERMDDVGGLPLSQLRSQRAGASERTRDERLSTLALAGQLVEQRPRVRVRAPRRSRGSGRSTPSASSPEP